VAAEAWRLLSRQRADAVREHLVSLGLAPQRVYTEQRSAPPAVTEQQTATAPLLIEAVGTWQGALAGMRGPTCVVQAMPPRARAVHV
jgi:outer membrane protein OmpA-like peptidoglycan-associated protein